MKKVLTYNKKGGIIKKYQATDKKVVKKYFRISNKNEAIRIKKARITNFLFCLKNKIKKCRKKY